MLIRPLLVFACVVAGVQCFHIEKGCEVKSTWEEQFRWPEIQISSWIPKDANAIFEFQIFFQDMEDFTDYDKIELNKNNYTFVQNRLRTSEKKYANISANISTGWNDFVFRIDGNYSLTHQPRDVVQSSQLLQLPIQVGYSLKSISIKGSNITLNCHSAMRVWLVPGSPVAIPFDSSKQQWLGFYSDTHFTPRITVGFREVNLRWDGVAVTTIANLEPLPPFIMHNISMLCTYDENIICTIKSGDNARILEEIRLSEMPKFLPVGRVNGNSFSVLLRKHELQHGMFSNGTLPISLKDSSQTNAAVSILGILLVIVIVILIAGSVWHFKLSKKKIKPVESTLEDQTETHRPLLPTYPNHYEKADFSHLTEVSLTPDFADSSFLRSNEQEKARELLNAVTEGVTQTVKILLNESGKCGIDSDACKKAFVEAHLLCQEESIKLFDSHRLMDRELLIQTVQREYNRRVDLVFEAAQKGTYRRGVAHLLDYYSLPSTIRNAEGLSLLHVIVSTKDAYGGPLWNARNIEFFLQNKSCYANAVDFEGRTCLHHLGINASNTKKNIIWDSTEMPVESTWCKLARVVVEFGCDPSIKDNRGLLPHEYARDKRNLKLSDYLKNAQRREVTNKKNIKKPDFISLVQDAEKGKTAAVMKTMKFYHQLLPMEATKNPLTGAVMKGHLTTTMLLLSGGAYVCGRPCTFITPLEAAHGAKSLPAIFPAVLRRECTNRLSFELKKAGKVHEQLCQHIERLIDNVNKGLIIPLRFCDETASDSDKSRSARELLSVAAKLGLTLTCQMFGLMNVNLQTYTDEVKPIRAAVQSGSHEIIYVLSRDLQMSVFSHTDESKLPKAFLDDQWQSEVKIIKSVLSKFKNSSKVNALLSKIKDNEKELKMDNEERDNLLATIAQYGLVYMLHVIKEKMVNFDVNAVVDKFTECTMLHIASMYGQSCLVEYLLNDAAVDVMVKCKRAFTAAHWAALRGHKDCVQFLQLCTKGDYGQCDEEHLTSEFLEGYKSQLNDYKDFLISDELGLEVWSSPYQADKALLLLENSFTKHNVIDQSSFMKFVDTFSLDSKVTRTDVLDEMKELLRRVSEHDPRYQGNITAYQSNTDGLKMPIDSIRIYWEVTSKVFNDHEINRIAKDNYTFNVIFKTENLKETFKLDFFHAVENVLRDFKFNSSEIWSSFPCVEKHAVGAQLFLLKYDKESKKTCVMKVVLAPVLKSEYIARNGDAFKHPVIRKCSQMESLMLTVNISKEKWTLVSVKLEDEILNRLSNDQRRALSGCKLLMKILYACWWFPRLENRRHNQIWHSYAFSLSTLMPNELISLFLEEVNDSKDEDWEMGKLIDRMISIFKRATHSKKGEIAPERISLLFFDSTYATYKTGYVIESTIKVLEKLKKS